jgi:hypothetical protein
MPANYVLLERIELNASAASVTFSNIPQTGYTDLKIVASARNTSSGNYFAVSFNGSTASFSSRYLYWENTTVNSGTLAQYGGRINTSSTTASTFASTEIYIPNYAGSTNKSYSSDSASENNAAAAAGSLIAGLWSNTAAITSITLTPDSASFDTNSTFSLYGLAALGTTPTIAPKASGGNIIETDGTYWIHTFTTSGDFVPAVGLTCDYLVVAGGGGGGAWVGGGGGAGGYQTSNTSVTAQSYPITVGAGGVGSTTGFVYATNGGNSVFSSVTSTGGGGGGGSKVGGAETNLAGYNGGSGGGSRAGGAVGTGVSGQGNSGGIGLSGGNFLGGGGGGASAAGTAGTSGGTGGNGTASSITGTSVTYAGGGGGGGISANGAGGSGGGGAGSTNATTGSNGTVNLGGGAGGGGYVNESSNGSGGNGGSGVVIIRYLAA